jgi:putative SOS response-associated peptidase YedK
MCGRYSVIRLAQIVEIIHNVTIKVDLSVEVARWNVAPGQDVLIITHRNTPTLEKARWGLVPSWATDPTIGNKMINARAETLREKPAFRNAYQSRRCALPADGFYEWRKNPDGTKTPMYIQLKSRESFAFAGIWESWISPEGEEITTCSVITTQPNSLMAPIHNRMPVILPREKVRAWLDGPSTEDEGLLCPLDASVMEAFAVSNRVNSPKHDGPQLIEPVEEPKLLF